MAWLGLACLALPVLVPSGEVTRRGTRLVVVEHESRGEILHLQDEHAEPFRHDVVALGHVAHQCGLRE